MIIWEYRFEDETKLELLHPLTGVELIKMWEKHGYVVVNFREVNLYAEKRL